MDKLTSDLSAQHRRFVDEYLIDLNGTRAAKRAGFPEASAGSKACQLLKRKDIGAAIIKAQEERSARTKIDADWLLRRLADEVEADLADLYHADGSLKPIHDWPMIWRKGLVSGIDIEKLQSGDATAAAVKLKLTDRSRKLEMIGRHIAVQAFKDNVAVDVIDRAGMIGRARQRASNTGTE